MKKLLLTLLLFSAGTGISAAKTYDLKSPDGKIAVRVDVGADAVTYSISRDGKELIAPSPLSLTLADGRVLGRKASVRKASAKSVDEIIEAPFYKRSAVEDRYNSLTLTFKGDYGIDFRAYDDGAAYRFRTSMKDEITVTDELVDIRFPEDFTTLVPYARDGKKEPGLARYYFNSFENTYSTQPVSKVADDRLAFLPILADAGTAKIVITEADLEDYPGMYLYNPTGGKALRGQAFRRARPHPDECDHCSISLQCVRICSAVSPCSAGRRMTMSCAPVSCAARAFSSKPPAAPPSLVTRKRMANCSISARFSA